MEKIDYIIPTWNSGATLEITLSSIERHGSPDQIIIVDRDSQDETLEIARKHGCKIIATSQSLGAARLEGARCARTELIGFVDSDVELTESWRSLLHQAWENKYKDAGVFGAYYKGCLDNTKWPLVLDGGNGAFGCIITYRSYLLECEEMVRFSSAEDGVYARFLSRKGLKWYIFPIATIHHQDLTKIPYYSRLRWMGAGLRVREGFQLVNFRRIIGGAVVGIRMQPQEVSYWGNWKIRLNYFLGYILYKRYYELDRNRPSKSICYDNNV